MEIIAKDESFVSVITAVNRFNIDSLTRLSDIQHELDKKFSDYEIILMAQKSVQKAIAGEMEHILKDVPCIRYLQLSSDVNSDVIWSAGTENAIGDFIVCFDLKSDPLSLITDSINLCRQGNDVIVGTAKQKQSMPETIPVHRKRGLMRWIAISALSILTCRYTQNSKTRAGSAP